MGTEAGGVYNLAGSFRKAGLSCGLPYAYVRNPLAVRHMPPHAGHFFWSVIRRFFEDFGLPPIAQIPADRISAEQKLYYTRLLARCISRSMEGESFIIADHLAAFVLAMVNEALTILEVESDAYFFYTAPEREIAALTETQGQPPKLTEFIWRNTLTSAIRQGGQNVKFIAVDMQTPESWAELIMAICKFYGQTELAKKPPLPVPRLLPSALNLSPLTTNLYAALLDYSSGGSWERLQAAANAAWEAQEAQNGWQYWDSLDCGSLHPHAKRLLSIAGKIDAASEVSQDDCIWPEAQAGWQALLDKAERKLLDMRADYEYKLFLHSDSVHKFYQQRLTDEILLMRQKEAELRMNMRKRRKRHAKRVRKLFDALQQVANDNS